MHEITAYVPESGEKLFRTEKGARRQEIRTLLHNAVMCMPSTPIKSNDDLAEFIFSMLVNSTYPTAADRLLEATDYLRIHRAVLCGPGIGN